jgi:NADH dehydrogenase
VHVTLIDRTNHHTFQPLLYQVATTVLSPGEIAYPIRAILRRHRNVDVVLGEVKEFDLASRTVRFDAGELRYDYLIVAAGASDSYFGHGEWEELAPGLKTVEDALEIRRRVLLAFELAERNAILGVPSSGGSPTFVVVGGGPTGVELAGALADIARRALARDFSRIDPKDARITLLEAGPRILPSFPKDLADRAVLQLRRLGVDVRTSAAVTAVAPGAVRLGDAVVPATVILWAAGVRASSLGAQFGDVDRAGRVRVREDLSVPAHPEVFVIGDLAAFATADGGPLPGLGAVATQQGQTAAENVWRSACGRPRVSFRYADWGQLATIGRRAAVAKFGRVHLAGSTAWFVWLFVHLMLLVGFRNRLAVLFEWAWAYFTFERSARLITGSTVLPGSSDDTASGARR